MTGSCTAYIGLGSNLGDSKTIVSQAIEALAKLPQTQLLACSSHYQSAPMGPQDQPDYINAVVSIETELTATELLAVLQQLELQFGRCRDGGRWGARSLDLDILLFADQLINEPDLIVPHAGLSEREFVLYPLFEIAPQLVIPARGALEDLVNACPRRGLVCVE